MKLRLILILLVGCVFGFYPAVGQKTGIHRIADLADSINFKKAAAADAFRKLELKEADDEDKMVLPHNLPLPSNARVMRDLTVPPPTNYNAPMSPAADTSFVGLTDNLTTVPPDVQGAAGPNYLMTALNSQVSILTKTGTVVSTVSLIGFWPSGFNLTEAFDPRLMYDPYGNKWILICSADPDLATASILVAVSATTDPTGSWYTYKIAIDTAQQSWLDYPVVGFNKNWIVINGNIYDNASGVFECTKFFILNKSSYYNKGPGTYTAISDSLIGGTVQPAICYDSAVNTEYLVQTWNGSAGYMAMYAITGAIGNESFANVAYISTPATWASEGPNGWNFAPQLGSTELIATDDDRMQKVVYRNGSLWCTHNVFLPEAAPTRSSIQWWQLSTAGAVLQRSLIDDTTGVRFYAYPSIAVNASNDVLIGYSSFSANQYASCDYSLHTTCDPANTFEGDYVYQAGQAVYYKTYGGTYNRWGDYSATCVDPVNDNDFWTLQEFATTLSGSTSRWSTAWASVKPGMASTGAGTWTWTGTISTDWFTGCNWDKGSVPGINSDVVIPGGTVNNPTVTGQVANCNTITINSGNGAIITINDTGGGGLNINQ
jgi:hypothetical protein